MVPVMPKEKRNMIVLFFVSVILFAKVTMLAAAEEKPSAERVLFID